MFPAAVAAGDPEPDGFVIRTAADPAPLVAAVRREALAMDPSLALT